MKNNFRTHSQEPPLEMLSATSQNKTKLVGRDIQLFRVWRTPGNRQKPVLLFSWQNTRLAWQEVDVQVHGILKASASKTSFTARATRARLPAPGPKWFSSHHCQREQAQYVLMH